MLFEVPQEVIFRFGPTFNFSCIHPKTSPEGEGSRLYHHIMENLIGKDGQATCWRNPLCRTFESGQFTWIEFEYPAPEGARTCDAQFIPETGNAGLVCSVLVICREVRYRRLYEQTPAMLHSIDSQARIVAVSNYWLEKLGYSRDEVIGRKLTEFLAESSRQKAEEAYLPEFFKTGLARDVPLALMRKNGEVLEVLLSATGARDAAGKFVHSLSVSKDVFVGQHIMERKKMESALLEGEKELRAKTRELEDVNITLNVMLKRGLKEKEDLHDNIITNIRERVSPFIGKLRNTGINDTQKAFLDLLESNLQEIASPFTRTISQKFSNLSPMEIQVAVLIKSGRRNKEISAILGLSINTILTHRYHLREKLGLTGEKVNLQSYLNSINF